MGTAMYVQHSGASLSQDELSLGRWSYGERVVQAEVIACARLGGVENRDLWLGNLARTSESLGTHSWALPLSQSESGGGASDSCTLLSSLVISVRKLENLGSEPWARA